MDRAALRYEQEAFDQAELDGEHEYDPQNTHSDGNYRDSDEGDSESDPDRDETNDRNSSEGEEDGGPWAE